MEKKQYQTRDLYYAAYLCVAGVPLQDTVKKNGPGGPAVFFIFEDGENIKELKQQFFNRKAKVSALQYADEIRNMKNQTHEAMNA
jgi:hypothetical protein